MKNSHRPIATGKYSSDLKTLSILLVEDSVLIQKTTSKALQREGYEVDIARNGVECLRMIEKKIYDFILMDLQMPVMDGIETTKEFESWNSDRQLSSKMHPSLLSRNSHKWNLITRGQMRMWNQVRQIVSSYPLW